MSKGKRGPALIELIHRQDTGGIREPTWFTPGTRRPEAEAAREVPADRVTLEAVERPVAVEPPAPLVSVRGERVVFSLSSASAGMAVFVLIVLLGGSFLIGRRSGERKGLRVGYDEGVAAVQAGVAGEIEAARRSAPDTGIFEGVGASPVTVAGDVEPVGTATQPADASAVQTPGRADSPWVQGHTYIVVQEFRAGDRDDAEAARLFLHEQGVETAILESGGNYKYRLVALKGFNRDAPAQRRWCDAYHARIKELGRAFVKAGGRYDLQGYQKKLTGPGW